MKFMQILHGIDIATYMDEDHSSGMLGCCGDSEIF